MTTFGKYHPGPEFRISSGYGQRTRKSGELQNHPAIDFVAPVGTAIRAASDGIVVYTGFNDSLGNTVVIRHEIAPGQFKHTLYAHMEGPGATGLGLGRDMPALGTFVSKGDVIGRLGNTGSASGGPHLHYAEADGDAPFAVSGDGGSLGFVMRNSLHMINPTNNTSWGDAGVYNNSTGSIGLLYKSDRFYSAVDGKPLYESKFTTSTTPAAAMISTTPVFNSENVRIGDRAEYDDGTVQVTTTVTGISGVVSITETYGSDNVLRSRTTLFTNGREKVEILAVFMDGKTGTLSGEYDASGFLVSQSFATNDHSSVSSAYDSAGLENWLSRTTTTDVNNAVTSIDTRNDDGTRVADFLTPATRCGGILIPIPMTRAAPSYARTACATTARAGSIRGTRPTRTGGRISTKSSTPPIRCCRRAAIATTARTGCICGIRRTCSRGRTS